MPAAMPAQLPPMDVAGSAAPQPPPGPRRSGRTRACAEAAHTPALQTNGSSSALRAPAPETNASCSRRALARRRRSSTPRARVKLSSFPFSRHVTASPSVRAPCCMLAQLPPALQPGAPRRAMRAPPPGARSRFAARGHGRPSEDVPPGRLLRGLHRPVLPPAAGQRQLRRGRRRSVAAQRLRLPGRRRRSRAGCSWSTRPDKWLPGARPRPRACTSRPSRRHCSR
jgi:hypothetical protein